MCKTSCRATRRRGLTWRCRIPDWRWSPAPGPESSSQQRAPQRTPPPPGLQEDSLQLVIIRPSSQPEQQNHTCVFSYLTSRRIWCSGTRRNKRLSPTCPGRWRPRSRTGSWADPSSNRRTEPTTEPPAARTRCTSPCRTGGRITDWENVSYRLLCVCECVCVCVCVLLPPSEAIQRLICSREDPSCWPALETQTLNISSTATRPTSPERNFRRSRADSPHQNWADPETFYTSSRNPFSLVQNILLWVCFYRVWSLKRVAFGNIFFENIPKTSIIWLLFLLFCVV